MMRCVLTALFIFVAFPGPVLASHTHESTNGLSRGADVKIPAAARNAVATVDRFTAALSAGDLSAVAAELDPDLLVLESGGAERSAAEYLGEHAKADAAFLKSAQHQLLRRVAHASGDFAWVASESELQVQKNGRPATVLNTETMVLQRRPAGWKIVHIDWSSRVASPSSAR